MPYLGKAQSVSRQGPASRPPANRSISASLTTPIKGTSHHVQDGPSTHCRPLAPQPSLTTEYTPHQRGGRTGTPSGTTSTPQAASQSIQPSFAVHTDGSQPPQVSDSSQPPLKTQAENGIPLDEGPDPSTLPPATAPPSHPSINSDVVGVLDGRSILEVDIAAMTEKPWRRPGSDISDWFNYGFDEISWEAYCYRRRDLGELGNVLKANVIVSRIMSA